MNRGEPQNDTTTPTRTDQGDPSPGELLRVARRASGLTTATKDDSGMIDLRALMASAKPPPPPGAPGGGAELTPLPVVRHLSIYPFGVPPEPEEPGTHSSSALSASRTSRRGLGLLLGLGAALLAGGAATLVLTRAPGAATETLPAQARTASPAAVESTGIRGTPEALPASAVPAPAENVPAETVLPAETAAPAPPKAPPRTRATLKSPPSQASTSAASASAKSPRPADTCKGDLLCAMKRATAGH